MRITRIAVLPLVAALLLAPRHAPAQVRVSIHLGRPVVVMGYAPEYYGEWETYYREWRPVTLYFYDGNYYPRRVRGARPVMVYRRGSEYFLPPRDQGWQLHGDRRFNYQRLPTDDDYSRARPPEGNNGRGNGNGRGRGHGGVTPPS